MRLLSPSPASAPPPTMNTGSPQVPASPLRGREVVTMFRQFMSFWSPRWASSAQSPQAGPSPSAASASKLDLTPESFAEAARPRPAAGQRVAAPQGRVADRRRRGPEEGGRGGQADRHLLHRRRGLQRAAGRLLKCRVSPPGRWFGPVHRRGDQAPQREVRLLRPRLVHQHQGRGLSGRVEAVLRRQAATRRRQRLAARHPAGADDVGRPAPRRVGQGPQRPGRRRFRKCWTPTRNCRRRSGGPRPWTARSSRSRRRRRAGWC